jgi:hypothetical protein
MGKLFLIISNLILLIGYKIFFGGAVEVEQKVPAQANPGEKFMVEVIIEKGDREGFAKWQQELPEGFIATAVETAGATWSFKKNTVKLIWMALPEAESYTISYEVVTDASINGQFDLNGKFSYIEENERKDIEATVTTITIGSGAIAQKQTSTPAPDEPENDDLIEEVEDTGEDAADMAEEAAEETVEAVAEIQDAIENTFTTPEDNGEVMSKQTVTESEDITIKREIIYQGNNQYLVNLYIEKDDFNSFGKVEEYIPPGFVASEKESGEGMFSFNNKVMKILWMALPEKDQLQVSYLMESQSDELEEATVHGVFSYLNEDESIQLAMEGSSFKNYYGEEIEEEDFQEEVEEAEEEIAQMTTKEEPIEETEETEIVESSKPIQAVEPKVETLESKVSNIPSPETGITYKVQIAAAKKEVQQNYFEERHKIKEPVSIEFHNNWYKYTVGSFGVYKQARDKRNEIWAAENKINDAFVTAYNSGERISVQEALMISNQKWYK